MRIIIKGTKNEGINIMLRILAVTMQQRGFNAAVLAEAESSLPAEGAGVEREIDLIARSRVPIILCVEPEEEAHA